jgi:hypothetical protein
LRVTVVLFTALTPHIERPHVDPSLCLTCIIKD